jgi:hypothetical protein
MKKTKKAIRDAITEALTDLGFTKRSGENWWRDGYCFKVYETDNLATVISKVSRHEIQGRIRKFKEFFDIKDPRR